jgi:hypothetical protein
MKILGLKPFVLKVKLIAQGLKLLRVNKYIDP